MQKIYVVGHRNPDLDSIASAIAYARLKNLLGIKNVTPARAGELDLQSEWLLGRLGFKPPRLLTDVSLRAENIMTRKVIYVNPDTPLRNALQLFEKHRIRLLPVIEEEKPKGILTLYRIAREYLARTEPSRIIRIHTSPEIIRKTLKGKAYNIKNIEKTFKILLADPGEFARIDNNTIVLLPDEVLLKPVLDKQPALIITPREIGRIIDNNIIVSRYDLITTAWLLRLALPVKNLCDKEYEYCYTHDRIRDIKKDVLESEHKGLLVLDSSGLLKGIITKTDIFKDVKTRLILVDHNEPSQAVYGIEDAEILEVVDHHRLGNMHTQQPIRFIVEPVGSTSTLVAREYRNHGLKPPRDIAILLLGGILSDTVILTSPTTTMLDIEMAKWLSRIARMDIKEYGKELFAASFIAGKKTPKQLLTMDIKHFKQAGKKLAIAQLFVADYRQIMPLIDELRREAEKYVKREDIYVFILMITNVLKKDSLLLYLGPRSIAKKLGYREVNGLLLAPGVVSRKKQILPAVLAAI